MNGFSSECSSGCESGWTMYLDHSVSPNPSQMNGGFVDEDGLFYAECKAKQGQQEEDADEEEDLSMVSDASSGPPHCHEDEELLDQNGFFNPASLAKNTNKRQKIKQPTQKKQLLQQHQQQCHSLLDDTASSPIFNFSKGKQQGSRNKAFHFSQGFSETHYNVHRMFPSRKAFSAFKCPPFTYMLITNANLLQELYAFQKHPDFLESSLPGKPTSAKPVGCRKDTGNRIW